MPHLAEQIRAAREKKDILLMTHLVLGYPSFAANRQVIRQMVENGVDLIEMQIPFSEPVADGPVIVRANQEAIAGGPWRPARQK
jgi:tryptophan synthase alpha chain